MKGDVFIAFNQMVEEQIGISDWETLLNKVKPSSGGIYISASRYDDAELLDLVSTLSEMKSIPVSELIEEFGSYLFDQLNQKYPMFTEKEKSFFGFLTSIDNVIHREVKKLYPETLLPDIKCISSDENTIILSYFSSRKLCYLAEGLIRGAARHYKVNYEMNHQQCMHNGYDHCLFKIAITSTSAGHYE